MSRKWNVHCRTCGSTHRFADTNHQQRLMLALVKHRSAIAALAPLMREPPVTQRGVWHLDIGGIVDTGWFAEHHAHDVVAMCEYGGILEVPPGDPSDWDAVPGNPPRPPHCSKCGTWDCSHLKEHRAKGMNDAELLSAGLAF